VEWNALGNRCLDGKAIKMKYKIKTIKAEGYWGIELPEGAIVIDFKETGWSFTENSKHPIGELTYLYPIQSSKESANK